MVKAEWREDPMRTLTETGREFWRGVLLAGGFTAIPRWSLTPVRGVLEHEATIPSDLVAALRRLADELAMPLSSVLLAAHAKVLADDRTRFVANLTAGDPSRRGRTALAQGLSAR